MEITKVFSGKFAHLRTKFKLVQLKTFIFELKIPLIPIWKQDTASKPQSCTSGKEVPFMQRGPRI